METEKKGGIRATLAGISESLRELIHSKWFLEQARQHPTDFTRNRKMSFTQVVTFMINLVKTSTQTALNRFFDVIGTPEIQMTQQSYSEARQKMNPEACRELFLHTTAYIYAHDVDRWHGMVLIAIDGSKLQLPNDKQLLKSFGGIGRGASSPTAQASIAYDMLNNVIVDAEIEPLSIGEHELAERHIERIAKTEGVGDALVIFDRGYSSVELIGIAEEKGFKFLVRLRRKFNLEIDALRNGVHELELAYSKGTLKVRVIKFALPSGEIETLVTNIFDAQMGIEEFKKLYFMRWPVETKYGELKLKLEVENFSGRTEVAIRQDFFISAMLSNVIGVAANEAQPAVDRAREGKKNKHRYKVNVNHAVGAFKDRFILALLELDPEKRAAQTEKIIELLCKHAVPERKDRPSPRNPSPRKARFHYNMKSNC
jgi:hypothetical protein